MKFIIKKIPKKDIKQGISIAKKAMNFDKYTKNNFELNIYSKYSFTSAYAKATVPLGIYYNKKLVGFMLVDFKHERKNKIPLLSRLFIKYIEKFFKLFGYDKTTSEYDITNQELLNKLDQTKLDGEITLFAIDPKFKGKGLGTLILNKLTKEYKNKTIYLYSDDTSTFQFYEKRNFKKAGEKFINLTLSENKKYPLQCYIYTKTL